MTPEALGALADEYASVQAQRLAADKVAAELKAKEEQLHAAILSELREQQLTAIGGKNVLVRVSQSLVPVVTDWDDFYKHILVTKDFSLLERRVSKAACKERWEDSAEVPGVSKYTVYRLSKSQVKG